MKILIESVQHLVKIETDCESEMSIKFDSHGDIFYLYGYELNTKQFITLLQKINSIQEKR